LLDGGFSPLLPAGSLAIQGNVPGWVIVATSGCQQVDLRKVIVIANGDLAFDESRLIDTLPRG
jgi:hypothetical protein